MRAREFIISDGHPQGGDRRSAVRRYQAAGLPAEAHANRDAGHRRSRSRRALAARIQEINFDTCKRSTWKAATRLPFVIYQTPHADRPGPEFDASLDLIDRGARARDRQRFLSDEAALTPGIVGVGLAGGSVADVIRLTASMQVVNEPRFLQARPAGVPVSVAVHRCADPGARLGAAPNRGDQSVQSRT